MLLHSTGFVRKALQLSGQDGNVAFLDFSGHDFDKPVIMRPTIPNQYFFRNMYQVLQDDLAGLVAPNYIVLCEGRKDKDGTDAKVYNTVFQESHPDTLFVSRGSSTEVEKGEIIPVLEAVVPSVKVWRLIDRDDMPDSERVQKHQQGIRVLRRREIENYLWDKAVIRKALRNNGLEVTVIDSILETYPFSNPREDDMKKCNRQQSLFEKIRNAKGTSRLGRDRREFASAHLAPALRETKEVYEELHEDVFPADLR